MFSENEKPQKRKPHMSKKTLAFLLCLAMAAALVLAMVVAARADQPDAGRAANSGGFGLTFGEFVGSNSFFNENQATYEIFGNIREYHPFGFTEWAAGWYEDANGVVNESIKGMNPQAAFMNSWGLFDNYYKAMHDKGIDVTLCVTGTADDRGRPDYQDPDGTGSEKPSSYLGHAQSMFQLAARYGSNKDIDPALVRVAAGTEKRIGLGYVKHYENYNEPNLNGFTGAQFAAMLSADYDGHMGTMGPGVGIKAADPNAKMVMGGIAGLMYNTTGHTNSDIPDHSSKDFLFEMLEWFEANRTLEQWKAANRGSEEGYEKYPFDVLSCHSYSTTKTAAHGISPEEDHLYERVSDYVRFCRETFPGKEVLLSEFGWDSAQGSPWSATVNATTNVGLNGPEVQGRWLVRQYLILAAAGIDRARQYMIPDTSDNPNNPGWFATCGMVYGTQGSANFKPSWYYVGTMNHILKDASLDDVEIIADGGWTASGGGVNGVETNGPWALKFTSAKNTDRIYALWLPTSHGDQGGANVQGYSVAVPAGYKSATLISLKDKVKWGERADVSDSIVGGSITVQISEKPVFLILSEDEYYNPVYNFIHPHNFTTWTLTPDSGDPSMLFDEMRDDLSHIPQPKMENSWSPGGVHRYAVVDLYAKYNLTGIYVWDRDGAMGPGKVFAAHAYIGEGAPTLPHGGMTSEEAFAMLQGSDWERVAWFDFASWETWAEAIVEVEARYIILGFEDGPSEFYQNPWPADWLPVPEMVFKGALAKGETPPPPPPVKPPPPPRTFERKPSSDEFRFLFDNDFEDGTIKADVSGGAFTAVDGKNADGTDGKILKAVASSDLQQFSIPASALSSVEYDRWYYVDYKFMLEDAYSAPELILTGPESHYLYITAGGNSFRHIWGPDGDIRVVTPDEWHQIQAKFLIDSVDNNISYEFYYDGIFIAGRTTYFTQELPLDFLHLRMRSQPDIGRSTFYYDDVWVYTRISSDTIINATFDRQQTGPFKTGYDGLTDLRNMYAKENSIIMPKADDAFYLGERDQLLRVASRSWMFDTTGSDVLQEIKVGEDYVFELSFFYEDVGDGLTKTPTFLFLYEFWMNQSFADTDWQGGLWVLKNDWSDTESGVSIKPTAGEWHRYVVKYRFETVSKITYSFYYDDITTPVVTVTLDSAVPGSMRYETGNLVRSMGILVGAEGIDMDKNPLYINDVLLYRGNIRPWPEKYSGVPVEPKYQVTVNDSYDPAPGSGSYAEGETVTISAGARTGYTFTGWTTSDNVELADPNAPTTTFVMPARAVTLKANFERIPDDRVPITSIKIDAPAVVTVVRGGAYNFSVTLNEGALDDGIAWSVNSPLFATVDADNTVRILNMTGSTVLTATDPDSGLSHFVILRIV